MNAARSLRVHRTQTSLAETDGDTVNVVVELKSAVVNGRTVTYDVAYYW